MTLGEALASGQTRNLDALRLVLAASVIVSHAWPLALGPGTPEPLEALTGQSLGGWAVALFFFLSGLLVTASAHRRTLRSFWMARARRILPGLGVALGVTLALAIASGASAPPSEAATWAVRALTLVSIEHRISGAFAANPMPEIVNGPLWSLFHEVLAYGICAVVVMLSGTRRRGTVAVLLAVATVAAMVAAMTADILPGRLATFAPLFMAFALGMAAHEFRDALHLRAVPAMLCLPLVAVAPWTVAVAALGYASLVGALRSATVPLDGDYSFGLYIYGWPVAQTLVQTCPGLAPETLAAMSLVATAPLAIASWYGVERPAMTRRRVAV